MYVGYICIVLSLLLGANGNCGDAAKKDEVKNDSPLEWFRLACTFNRLRANDPEHPLNMFPDEIVKRIVSFLNPKSILDDWWHDSAVCQRTVHIPHSVLSFDLVGGRFIGLVPKTVNPKVCQEGRHSFYYLDLAACKAEQCFCEYGTIGDLHTIAWCGDNVVVETSDEMNGNGLFFTNIVKKNLGTLGLELAPLIWGPKVWKCHPYGIWVGVIRATFTEIYKLSDKNKEVVNAFSLRGTHDAIKSSGFQWHPQNNELFAFTYDRKLSFYDSSKFILCDKPVKQKMDENDTDEYDPQFALEKNIVYAQHGNKLVKYNMIDDCAHTVTGKDTGIDMANVILRGVGDGAFLVEHKKENKAGDKIFEMRLLNGAKESKPMPMTTFNNPKDLYKLPTLDDNRYVTVTPDPVHGGSMLSIYTPASDALLQHYCIFKMLLKIEELKKQMNGNVFFEKKSDSVRDMYKELMQQTLLCYRYTKSFISSKMRVATEYYRESTKPLYDEIVNYKKA